MSTRFGKKLRIAGEALKYGDLLIIADLHLGLTENVEELKEKIVEYVERTRTSALLINGDLKHIGLFGLKRAERFLREVKSFVGEVILVRGNHDANLKELGFEKYYTDGSIAAFHGNVEYKIDSDILILSHSHPAYFIKDVVHGYKERVWLEGKYEEREVIVTPTFNELCSSTAVNLERPAGFIFKKVKKFSVYTIDGIFLGDVEIQEAPSVSKVPP